MDNDFDFNYNVSDYTLSELMAILGISSLDEDTILNATNPLIAKYVKKEPKLSVFFNEIQSKLIEYSKIKNKDGDNVYPESENQVNNWYENEVLSQKDSIQQDKITDRKQKIDVFGNEHVPMNREQIATTDTYNVHVKQDSLNPNLKNTISRFINLDSQFRQYSSNYETSSTNYTLDLSDTLTNVINLKIYSYQIPYSWYTVDVSYGNTTLWIVDGDVTVPVVINSGNYTPASFVNELTTGFNNAGFSFPSENANVPVYFNPNNGLITLNLYGGTYDGEFGSFTVSNTTLILFYDVNNDVTPAVSCNSISYFNSTLGWLMGFRVPQLLVLEQGNTASAILDLNGTKYLILVIDDFNQNHINNSLVSISKPSNNIKMPNYFSFDVPFVCKLKEKINNRKNVFIAEKFSPDYNDTLIALPSAPRTLTNAQLYTINTIYDNNNNLTNYLCSAPTAFDILGILPVKTSTSVPIGSLIVEFSGSLQDNQRSYFGPVNIERLKVQLLDDKGRILNLNGNDWCVTIVAECLYQY